MISLHWLWLVVIAGLALAAGMVVGVSIVGAAMKEEVERHLW